MKTETLFWVIFVSFYSFLGGVLFQCWWQSQTAPGRSFIRHQLAPYLDKKFGTDDGGGERFIYRTNSNWKSSNIATSEI